MPINVKPLRLHGAAAKRHEALRTLLASMLWAACCALPALTSLAGEKRAREAAPSPTLHFSVPGGIYTNDFALKIDSHVARASVHFTLDGSEPTKESPRYSAPLAITNSVMVRARTFDPESGAGPIVTETYTLLAPDLLDFSSRLPLVIVNTFGHPLERDAKDTASLRVIDSGNGRITLRSEAEFDGRAVMNIRGRASLRYPKRSYTVKLLDADDDYLAARLLGMPAESDWILYAPFPDKTLMRDVIAYGLHAGMGHWAPRTRVVEVFVSEEGRKLSKNDYAGVYVFEERVKRDKNRLNIKKLTPDDNSEPKLSGGYLFKKDHIDRGYFGQPDLTGGGAGQSSSSNRFGFPTPAGGFPADPAGFLPAWTGRTSSSSSSSSSSRSSSSRRSRPAAITNHVGVPQANDIEVSRTVIYTDDEDYIVQKEQESFKTTITTNRFYFVDPEPYEITAVQKAWLKTYLDQAEAALYGPDFKDPAKGYRAFLDVDSFIDHHLMVEVTKNVDGYRFSTFYSKDRGGKIKMEPLWDWNLSFGNANGKQGWVPEYWLWPQLDDREYTWFRRLFEDPDFGQRYVDRWEELRGNILATSNVLARVDELAALLDEAQKRNFERWPILGLAVNPNFYVGQTYADEVQWMKDWIAKRLAWMDAQFVAAPVAEPAKDSGKITLTASKGKIFYTTDGSDPRATGGAPAEVAKVYDAPVALGKSDHLVARALKDNRWSARTESK